MLADLLCPKKELWDQVLEITIENLRFIGFPVSLSSKSTGNYTKFARTKSMMKAEATLGDQKESLSCFSVSAVYNTEHVVDDNFEAIKKAFARLSEV